GGFKFSHPDLTPFEEGWNTVDNVLINAGTDNYVNNSPVNPHGMYISGIIGAQPNNYGTNTKSVGAAYNASLHPYLMSNAISSAQISIALQKAFEQNVDVVNMSFKAPFDANWSNQIANGIAFGRPDGMGGYRGIVYVASIDDVDQEIQTFPASLATVIGVGMSNPDDLRS